MSNKCGYSKHKLQVFKTVKLSDAWLDHEAIANKAGISERTVRAHCLDLTELGVFERSDLLSRYKYRMAPVPERNHKITDRLEAAAQMAGL